MGRFCGDRIAVSLIDADEALRGCICHCFSVGSDRSI